MITIATLRASGLTSEQIITVLETAENERLNARREQNRVNQQNHRNRVSADSADNADSADRESALSMLPSFPESQTEKPKEEKKERAKRDRGHVCPDDMRPSESHFEAGSKQNISRPRVEAICEAMKLWSKSNSNRAVARKSDWNAALFGWISREAERGNGNGPPNRPNGIGKPNANGITGTANGDRCRELAELARQGEAAAGFFRPAGALRGD